MISSYGSAVLSVHEFDNMGEKCRLLKCRNMWGSSDWESDWNVKSPKWTQSLKAQLGVTDEADGIFYVSLNEYAVHFKNTVICF